MKTLAGKLGLFLALAIAVSTATLAGIAYWQMRGQVLDQLQHDIDKTIEAQSTLASSWLAAKKAVVEANVSAVLEDNPKPLMQRARAAGGFGLYYIGFADKRTLYSDQTQPPPGYDPTKRPWYKLASGADGVVVSHPYMSVLDKVLVVTVAAPARKDGQLVGVMAANMGLDFITRQMLAVKLAGDGFAMLVHKDGTLVAYPQPDKVLKPISAALPEIAADRIAELAAERKPLPTSYNGAAHQLVLRPIAGTDWYLGLVVDRAAALAPLDRLLVLLAGATVLVLLLSLLIAVAGARKLLGGLSGLHRAMLGIAAGEGDLTQRLSAHSADEVGQSAQAMNRFLESLQSMFRQVRAGAESLTQEVHRLAGTTSRLAQDADQQAHELGSAAATIEQLTVSIAHTADSVREAEQLAQQADRASGDSAHTVEQMAQEIASIASTVEGLAGQLAELGKRSEQIDDIVAVIKGIADQTNLLALNAAIEAARAGEQGRGFAVVADEVRQLAARTSEATVEIGSRIAGMRGEMEQALVRMGDTQQTVAHGVAHSSEAVAGIQVVRQALGAIAERVREIADATAEHSIAATEMAQRAEQVNTLIQSSAVTIRSTDRTLQELDGRAAQLGQLVARFKL
jgi:methyl-accepting chemotaxis protein